MADFSQTGRGAALRKVLEKPLRKPGLPSSTESSENIPPPSVPRGRGLFVSKQPTTSLPQSTQPSQPPTAFGRGFLQHSRQFPSVPQSNLTPPLSQQSVHSTGSVEPVVPGGGSILTPPMSQLSIGQSGSQGTASQRSMGGISGTPPNSQRDDHGVSGIPPSNQRDVKGAPRDVRTPLPKEGHVTPPRSSPREVHGSGELKKSESASPVLPTSKGINKKGTSGKNVTVGVNYLALQSLSNAVYQYAVSFSPSVESRNMRYSMLHQHSELTGTTKAFDGSILYLPLKITDTSVSCTSVRQTDGAEITITITLTSVLQFNECLQLFNIIIRRVLRSLDLKQLGRQYYDQHHSIQVPQHKMELWPGYVTAVHQFDGGLLLLLDVSHKLLRMDTALDFMYELYHSKKQNFQEEAMRQLVGTVVLTRYNNRTYRIDDIAWDKNPQSTFTDHTGKAVSFVQYYKTAYNKTIEDKEQPLLLHRPKQRRGPKGSKEEPPEQVICLVPELCSMTGLTDAARSDFKVMKDLATYTRLTPNERDVQFKKFVETVHSNTNARKELESWGLTLHPSMLVTQGRALPFEKILFLDKSVISGAEADWGKHIVKEQVISAVPLKHWALVFCKRDSSKATEFFNMLKKVSPSMGIMVNDPLVMELPNDRTETYVKAIRDQMTPSMQIMVIIFPSQRDDRYSSIKKLCCIEVPIPSQVINSRTISQPQKLRSVTQKIALQMNCKMGGELWAVDIPLKNVMVVGIDVFHDSSAGKRSVLGIVSSSNRHFTRWYSRVFVQDKNQEIADSLKVGFYSALTSYHEINKTLPERIVVFRDGVGDSQMDTVVQFEVPQVKKSFQMFGSSYDPKLVVVVVQKRISSRILLKGSKGYENPSPGTLVDHTITRKGWYDFFLVSQHVRQGTVTPTHYNVVVDTTTLTPDHMQRLTYKLTHMYYNWPGTVRVPAPCQYAHKLAFLVGQSLHRPPSIDLCNRLFFL